MNQFATFTPPDRGAMSVTEFCTWAGISRASFYRFASHGQLRVVKIGRKSVVTMGDAYAWLASLPAAQITKAA